jgi:hypothetical protein
MNDVMNINLRMTEKQLNDTISVLDHQIKTMKLLDEEDKRLRDSLKVVLGNLQDLKGVHEKFGR